MNPNQSTDKAGGLARIHMTFFECRIGNEKLKLYEEMSHEAKSDL